MTVLRFQGRVNPTTGILNPNYRDPRIISGLRERAEVSPDFHELKFYKRIPLFVYGTDMKDGEDFHNLAGAEYLGRAHTISNLFFMRQNYYWPIAFATTNDDNKKSHIRGELYHVSPEHILIFDKVNMKPFHRVKARFCPEEQENKNDVMKSYKRLPFITGFMYIGNLKYWEKSNLTLSARVSYPSDEKLKGKSFYYWSNEKDENDYGGSFWGANYGRYDGHSSH